MRYTIFILRCDNKFHCHDYSDEDNCIMLDINPLYDSHKPPKPADIVEEGTNVPHTIVTAHVTIMNILDINDAESIFKIFFSLELVWNDLNIDFCFLKNDTEKNIVVVGDIWYPELEFMHLKKEINLLNDAKTIQRVSRPRMKDDLDEINACESFKGSENPIHLLDILVAEFICGFDEIIRNYPFGTGNCSFQFFIKGSDNQLTNLSIGSLTNEAEVISEYLFHFEPPVFMAQGNNYTNQTRFIYTRLIHRKIHQRQNQTNSN